MSQGPPRLGSVLECIRGQDKAEFFRRLALNPNVSAVACELGFVRVTYYKWGARQTTSGGASENGKNTTLSSGR